MKQAIRNFFIICFYLTGIPCLRVLFYRLAGKPILRVACFHEIKDSQKDGFEEKLILLKRGFNLISPQDFLNEHFSKEKINVLLTFDDGFGSWLKNVVPVLRRHNLAAIFFVDQRGFGIAPKISAMGFEIGGHSLNHSRLTCLSAEKLQREIKSGKEQLEKLVSKEIRFFAYPFGDKKSFNGDVIKAIKEAGFRYAFTILPGINKKSTNPYLLRRDGINVAWSNFLLLAWLRGAYDQGKQFLTWFESYPKSNGSKT